MSPQIPSSPLLTPTSSNTSRLSSECSPPLLRLSFSLVSLRSHPLPVFAFWIFQMFAICLPCCIHCLLRKCLFSLRRHCCCCSSSLLLLVVGWWLVVGGWWLVAVGCWLLAVGSSSSSSCSCCCFGDCMMDVYDHKTSAMQPKSLRLIELITCVKSSP